MWDDLNKNLAKIPNWHKKIAPGYHRYLLVLRQGVGTEKFRDVEAYVDATDEQTAIQHARALGHFVVRSYGEVDRYLRELGPKNQGRKPGQTNVTDETGGKAPEPEGYAPRPEGYTGQGKTWEVTVTYAGARPQAAPQPNTQRGQQSGGVPESATDEEWYESLYGKAAARIRMGAASTSATYSETVTVEAETQDKAIEKVQQKAEKEGREIVELDSVRVYDEKNKKWVFTHVQTLDWKVIGQDRNEKWTQVEVRANSEKEARELAKQKGVVYIADVEVSDINTGKWVDPSQASTAPAPGPTQGSESAPQVLWEYTYEDRKGNQFKGQMSAATPKEVSDALAKQRFDVVNIQRAPDKKQPNVQETQNQGPRFQYEAMDHTGKEVKDSIDADSQEEAQQLLRQKGLFVTKITDTQKKQPWHKRLFGKVSSLEQHADLIRDTLGMTHTANLVRQAAQVARAVKETVQTDSDIDPVVTQAVKQASQDILKVTDYLRQTNNRVAQQFASQIEQDFVDALSFRIGA